MVLEMADLESSKEAASGFQNDASGDPGPRWEASESCWHLPGCEPMSVPGAGAEEAQANRCQGKPAALVYNGVGRFRRGKKNRKCSKVDSYTDE